MKAVIRGLIALVPQDAESHVGQRGPHLPAADMVIGNGDDRPVLIGQIVEGDLIIRSQGIPQKLRQFHIMLQKRVGNNGHAITSSHRNIHRLFLLLYRNKALLSKEKFIKAIRKSFCFPFLFLCIFATIYGFKNVYSYKAHKSSLILA